jgi:hypothetical protein
MTERTYHYRISPEVISNDLFLKNFSIGFTTNIEQDECCSITTPTTTRNNLGYTFVYSSMTQILSGGTNGSSLLTGLTIPIFLTENTVDVGYYSVFDGIVGQQDVVTNFIFTGSTNEPYKCTLYNTSDVEFKKFLSFAEYRLDWGDGTIEILDPLITEYQHIYGINGTYIITLNGQGPWGENVVKKTINIPFTDNIISNPNGEAYFIPLGGNWSGIPISYEYIYSADSICDIDLQVSSNYTTVPFIVSGITNSRLPDLQVYGKKVELFQGKYLTDVMVTGTSGTIGIVYSPPLGSTYIPYMIDGIDYYDYDDFTLFFVQSSGITEDMIICSALTKNEVLLNVISETQIETDIYVERGKNSALEKVQRLGEVDNIGDLNKYGYKFFTVKKI